MSKDKEKGNIGKSSLSGYDGAIAVNLLLLPSRFEKEILMFLKNDDGINISMSTLRRHLKSLGLFRRKAQSDVPEQMLHGYKFMHLTCIQSGLVVTQRTVQLRQRNRLRGRLYINPGPNFLWHVNSYDKLCVNN